MHFITLFKYYELTGDLAKDANKSTLLWDIPSVRVGLKEPSQGIEGRAVFYTDSHDAGAYQISRRLNRK